MVFLIRRVSWRPTAVALLVMLLAMDLCSARFSEPGWLHLLRFAHGLAGGALIGVAMSVIARSRGPERTFALLIMIQLLLGGTGTAILTPILETSGPGVVWLSLVGFTVLTLALVPLLDPDQGQVVQQSTSSVGGRAPLLPIGMALLAFFLFQSGQMAAFVYVIELGLNHGFDGGFVSLAVAASLWIGGPAALFVAWWSTRSGRLKPVFSCVLATVLSVSLYLMPHPAAFVAACIGFGIFFSLAFPYIIGVSTEMDNLGQVAAVAGFISSLGLATGPAIAAALVGESRYELVVLFALGSLLASALLIIYPARLLDSRSKQGRVQWPAGAMAEPVTRPGVSH
jgi:MFS family permease